MLAERETNRHICIAVVLVFFLFFQNCHHLFILTQNMIISLSPMWFMVRKMYVSVWLGSGLRKESVVVFVHLSLLDAPCVSLTLSLIIRYMASCWGGQVLLGLSYIHPQSRCLMHTDTCMHTHKYIHSPTHQKGFWERTDVMYSSVRH